jgi:hypothetical protein
MPHAPHASLVRKCPWCGGLEPDPSRMNCRTCAGPLPLPLVEMQGASPAAVESRGPGPKPPPPPRVLPKPYVRKVLYWQNILTMIGVIFTLVFFWTVIFAAIGIPMWMAGLKRGRRELRALELGRAVEGRITAVEQDMTQAINNRHPWIITYAFPTAAGTGAGTDTGWEPLNSYRRAGDPVWIVTMDDDPQCNAIWPPVS